MNDPRSPPFGNLRYLTSLTSLEQPFMYSKQRVRMSLPRENVPKQEKRRLGLLASLLKMRSGNNMKVQDNKAICAMIDSLCST